MAEPTIEVYEGEDRRFPPSPEFQAKALVSDNSLYEEASADYEAFWARQARELLTWRKDFSTTLDWDLPNAKWFADGQLNMTENCLDRHVEAGRGDKVAYHWEGEPGDTRTVTYSDLLIEVKKFANVLKGLGLEKGDRVAIYMPMILELPIAMLACARIGVAHSVIFGGFSPDAIKDRCEDADARLIITSDGGYRRGAPSALKVNVDAALESGAPSVENVIVVNRCDLDVTMADGRDHWWHDLMADASDDCPAEAMDAEQLLYLLYTSGTTAKPKGIMHTTAGYLTHVAFTHKYTFDVHPDTDVYWCAADIGWVTGHSYIVYGPLTNGCTSVMYEGTPDTPREQDRTGDDRGAWRKNRLWDIIDRYKVTQFYTAPTAIRTFMKWGVGELEGHDLSTLRVLGTVGEPINPEAWMWYHEHIGHASAPIVDTWWQTETGGHMITPLPGVTTTKPGSGTHPIPGVFMEVVDDAGNVVEEGGGYLTITKPWPGMLRGIWGNPERFMETYWSQYPGRYFAGDGARLDADGYLWVLGRVDDVMNISGHRMSTSEIESALVDHPAVAEAAVVGATDETTGQAIVGYTILVGGFEASDELRQELRAHVAKKLGPIARPRDVFLVPDLPKTRSGKIMRRLLRDVAEGKGLGDTTTLADESVVEAIRSGASSED
ncbi:MAG: acetate--CoA ligase [Acidimicrobiales bacterium]|nr:acetate--CoA ligase [Acidimicrobiales bacterium]